MNLSQGEATVIIALIAAIAPTIASVAALVTALRQKRASKQQAAVTEAKLNRILSSPAVDARKAPRPPPED